MALQVNKKQLRTQYTRLALLRACGVLFGNQDKLRNILMQPIPTDQIPLIRYEGIWPKYKNC